MKNIFYACISMLFLFSCSVDSNELNEQEEHLTQTLSENINLERYKGVFTTTNSKYRGKIYIVFPIQNELNTTKETIQYPIATLITQENKVFKVKANKAVYLNENLSDIHFKSKDLEFTFSIKQNTKNASIDNVTFKRLPGSILAVKSTQEAPLSNFTGTYNCVDCGNPEPMTFNVIVSNDGTGNQTYDTQMNFNGQTYIGEGVQNGCLIDDTNSDLTFCNAESGDGTTTSTGFTVGPNGYTVEWVGQMAYANNTPNCSELVGLWYFRRGTSSQKSGTFKTDNSDSCLERLVFENFEDADVHYTSSVPEFSDGSGDYFIRTNGDNISGGVNFNDIVGNSFFAAQDIDGEVSSATQSIVFENLDVSLYTSIYFDAIFAEDQAGNEEEDWDDSDYLNVEYSFDDGTNWNTILSLRNDGSTFNSAPFIDTDFDGIGDGEEVTDTFKPFRAVFENNTTTNPTSSTTVSVRITISLNSADEDIAIDNVLIRGF